ncbi:hypothetical protein AcV5_003255 [Taiwanofungus camphoratus]|nr:hypothetical protein AcV5_003255 [Antrodia cinnamomea]
MRFKHLFSCSPFSGLHIRLRLPFMSAFDDTVHLKRLFEPRDKNPCRDNKPYSIVTLEHLYVSGDPRLYDCVISEITLWKSRSLPNHEFVVAQVSYQGRIIGALRIERTIMPTDGPSANSSSVSLTSSPSSPGLRAHDPITIYTSEDIIAATRDSHKIAPYILTETVTIASVIAACFVLNQEYPVYQLPSKQCYWFAGLAFRLIAGDNVMQQMEARDTRRAGDFGSFIHVMREPDMTQQAQTFRPKFEAKLQMIEDGVAERKRMLSVDTAREEAERRLTEKERQNNALELELRRYRQMHLETTASEEPSRQP